MKDLTTPGHSGKSVARVVSKSLGAIALCASALFAQAELGEPEKDELKFGFIKLTDMAPIAVAYENGERASRECFSRSKVRI